MAICNNKKCSTGECEQWKDCTGYVPVVTNADRIRAMSDEELAKEMRSHAFALAACSEKAWLEWLKQPAGQKVIKIYKKVVDK